MTLGMRLFPHMWTTFGVSERRACSVLKVHRRTIRYRSRRPDDGALRRRLRELASERRLPASGISAGPGGDGGEP